MTISGHEIMRFCGVGGVSSGLYFGLALALNIALELAPVASSVLAYAGGALFAFFAHRHFTFRSDQLALTELPKFLFATAVGLTLALVIPVLLSAAPPIVAFLAVLIVVPICSFTMMKIFVFSE